MMRYVFIAAVLLAAACTVPPMTPPPEQRVDIPLSPVITITAPREVPKKQIERKTAPCVGISTGDPVEDTRAKLDCLALQVHG